MSDIVERLRKLEELKLGDPVPPEFYDGNGSWAALMSKLCGDGANEIERLRAQVTDLTRLLGCAAVGKEFSEIKKGTRANLSMLQAAGIASIPEDESHD